MICKGCGREFTPTHGNNKYCSVQCRDKHSGRITYNRGTTGTCKECGRPFKKIYGSEQFCSIDCRKIATYRKKQADRQAQKQPIAPRNCLYCGKEFTPKRSDTKYCCHECADKHRTQQKYCGGLTGEERERVKREHQRLNQMKAVEAWKAKANAKPKPAPKYYTGTCAVCGKTFTTRNPAQKTCSKQCGKKLQYARKQSRIPKEQIIDKDITLEALYRRDSGVCYLCGGLCDWADKDKEKNTVGAKYPSIDHIIPIARGGLHSWGNVRLAHFKCNVMKSDSLIENAEDLIPANAYELKKEPRQFKKTVQQFTRAGELIATYDSTAEAERKTGINQKAIQNCARGRTKSAHNFVWRYKGA